MSTLTLVWVYIIDVNYYSFCHTDTAVCTSCCSALDHIVSYIFKQLQIKGKYGYSRSVELKDFFVNLWVDMVCPLIKKKQFLKGEPALGGLKQVFLPIFWSEK